jgi:peptidoglycan/xylan/chitin deacetylase (PgdA/CDA1 family)
MRPQLRFLPLVGLATLVATACRPVAAPAAVGAVQTQAFQTALAQISMPTSTTIASEAPVPTPTAVRTPPALPGVYHSTFLDRLDVPHTYISDACTYLKDKWKSGNATPGTVVMVVMFHGIQKDPFVTDPKHTTAADFRRIMNGLHDQGFQAITATQLADFLDHNTKIPPRSVVLIQDDRHAAGNYDEHFRPYWERWGWPVVNAWISAFGADDPVLSGLVPLSNEGLVDIQAHGVVHCDPSCLGDSSSDEFIASELQGSIANLQAQFNKTPVAIIWPGGGFGLRPVQFARSLGFRLGFTVNPRGPVMYNWVPLADQADPGQPNKFTEGYVNDPRMVLPRYWPSQVLDRLDQVRIMGEEAAAYAAQNKALELEYYDIVCAATYGPIP